LLDLGRIKHFWKEDPITMADYAKRDDLIETLGGNDSKTDICDHLDHTSKNFGYVNDPYKYVIPDDKAHPKRKVYSDDKIL
jgi:hypothetical protein